MDIYDTETIHTKKKWKERGMRRRRMEKDAVFGAFCFVANCIPFHSYIQLHNI